MTHDQRHKVFVYGSLKRGECNHHYMATGRFVCRARTTPEFRLYSLGRYPTLGRATESPCAIVGEVFEVDDAALAAIDRLEDNGRLYQREQVVVHDLDDERTTHRAWVYLHLGSTAGLPLIAGDTWRDPRRQGAG